MMRNSIKLFFLVCIFSAVQSCKKDEKLPPEPSIEFVSLTPSTILQFKDEVTVTIKYKDNNGDLGYESADQYPLQVKDSRLTGPDWYHVSPLAPLGQELKIEGELKIKISSMFILGNGHQEVATLAIKIKDRAGNWSNEILTPPITIKDTL